MSEQVDISKLVKKGLETDKCSVKIEGSTVIGDGFMGDVKFVKVIYDEPTDTSKELHLVVKSSKPEVLELAKDAFRTEMIFFNEIIPIFKKFLEDRDVKTFNVFPKCYKAFKVQDIKVIILENLKKQRFETHSKTVPMNIDHLKAALKQYARYHAISLALKDQGDIFKIIEEKITNTSFGFFIENENSFVNCIKRPIRMLNRTGRIDLADKFQRILDKGISKIIERVYKNVPKEAVLLHGDTNSNNFLFKYEGGSRESPSSVVIIDFADVAIHSPMLDISSFLYSGASKEALARLEELLKCYHDELSAFLTQLGSDPDKVFPESAMWEHWRKYSFCGFMGGVFIAELFNGDEMPATSVDIINNFGSVKMSEKNEARYLERILAISEHYFQFNDLCT